MIIYLLLLTTIVSVIPVLPDLILPAMLVPMGVLTIIIVLLCVAICVVYYLRKEDTTM